MLAIQAYYALHQNVRVNCAEMAGDRLRQPAHETFSIKRRF